MKTISALTFTDGMGFFIDLEDAELAVTVTPNDGDIIFHEGEGLDRFDGVSLSGDAVEEIQVNRVKEGVEIIVRFKRGQQSEKHQLGLTRDEDSAVAWVKRVNKIYENKRCRPVKFQGQPTLHRTFVERIDEIEATKSEVFHTIDEILATGKNIILPGEYLYSADDGVPPSELPKWQDYYVKRSIERLKEYSSFTGDIEIIRGNPPYHDYLWLAERIKYGRNEYNNRITQPLELMFDREPRREKIGVIPLGKVTNFALVYYRGQPPEALFQIQSGDLVAKSFQEWLKMLTEVAQKKERIIVCAPEDQSVYYSLKDAVFRGEIEDNQMEAFKRTSHLAQWLHNNVQKGIIACDIGVAHQIIHYLRRENFPGCEKTDFCHVPYEHPVTVGLCYRVDDPKWGELCALSLADCLTTQKSEIQESLAEAKIQAGKLGIEWLAA